MLLGIQFRDLAFCCFPLRPLQGWLCSPAPLLLPGSSLGTGGCTSPVPAPVHCRHLNPHCSLARPTRQRLPFKPCSPWSLTCCLQGLHFSPYSLVSCSPANPSPSPLRSGNGVQQPASAVLALPPLFIHQAGALLHQEDMGLVTGGTSSLPYQSPVGLGAAP